MCQIAPKYPPTGYGECDGNSPSDLFLFVRDKIKVLEKQDFLLFSLLSGLKKHIEDGVSLRTNSQSQLTEISNLQLSISDLQVFLIREREENLRIAAENDILRIKEMENNRAIEVLMQLSGISREQLKDIVSNEPNRCISNENNHNHWEEDLSREGLMLQIRSLKTQLDNMKTLFRSEVDVLLKDREVLAEERMKINRKLKQEVSSLSKQLYSTQKELCDTCDILLTEQKERKLDIVALMDSRRLTDPSMKTNSVNNLFSEEAPVLAALKISGIGRRKTRASSQHFQEQGSGREDMVALYQQQAKRFEKEAKTWKEKAETAEAFLKEKIRKISSELSLARSRYEDLDRRRILEGQGFRSDIKILRDKLRDLEKKLNKIKSENAVTSSPSSQDDDIRLSTRNTFIKAKQLEKELAALKLKVAALIDPFC